MIRAVIFDLDGTLIHSLPGIANSLNHTLSLHAHPTYSLDQVESFIGHGIAQLIAQAWPHPLTEPELAERVAEISHHYANNWHSATTLYPQVAETLTTLTERNIPIAICTNKPHSLTGNIVKALLSDHPFTHAIGHSEQSPAKPAPTTPLAIAADLQISPSEIAFVGDSTVDTETAHNAGMIGFAALWGYDNPLANNLPSTPLQNISDLLNHI